MKEIKSLIEDLEDILIKGSCPQGDCLLPRQMYIDARNIVKILTNKINEIEKIHNYTKDSAATDTASKEMVNHPTHYNSGRIECIDVMLDVFGKDKVLAFCELNAFKYLWRSDTKGTDIQDKKKAIWYINKYTELKNEI